MEQRRQLRILLKLRAKGLFFTHLLVCIAVTLITYIISMLGGYAAGLVLPPANELLYAVDLSAYYPRIFLFYGILLGLGLLTAPLTMGSYAWFSELSMMRTPKVRDLFLWVGDFKLAIKAFGAALWFLGIWIVWGLVFLAIPVGIVILVSMKAGEMALSAVLFLTGFLLLVTISGVVLTIVRASAYLPALFVLAAHPTMPIREAFRECGLFMAGRRWEFAELLLSFLGWLLLGSVTCGLITFYLQPYFNLTVLAFTQHARATWLLENGKGGMDTVWTPETIIREEDDTDV